MACSPSCAQFKALLVETVFACFCAGSVPRQVGSDEQKVSLTHAPRVHATHHVSQGWACAFMPMLHHIGRWKDGASNTIGSGKVKVGENKLLQKKGR